MKKAFFGPYAHTLWNVEVLGEDAGQVGLYQTERGYAWLWTGKPEKLISVLGVAESPDDKPFVFMDSQDALDHLMVQSGIAFHGHWGMSSPQHVRAA